MSLLSMDLRKRVVEAYEAGEGTIRTLAVRFKVSSRTISRYLARVRATGSVAPSSVRGKPSPKIDETVLRSLWEADPDAIETELVEALYERTGVRVHRGTVGRTLKRMGLTRKKRRTPPRNRTTPTSRPSSTRSPPSTQND